MYEIGRLCVKIAGRDAGLRCVIVDVLENNFVLIDGQTRRRKCNIKHLEPLKEIIKIKKNSSSKDVASEFKKLKLEIRETKPKKTGVRPKRIKKEKTKLTEEDIKATTKNEVKVSEAPKEQKKEEGRAHTLRRRP